MTRKPRQHPTFSSRISRDTAAKAVDALLKWIRSQPKHQKAQLLENDEVIHLVVTTRKIPPKARINPHYIPLPHSLHSLPDAAVCLFVDDRTKSPVQPADVEARIRSESIPVTDVISLSSLKTDYIPYESRRKLCGSYDFFFSDRRIIHMLPRLIGKQFFKKKKHPLPVDLSHKNWTAQLTRGFSSALLYMRTGTCCQLNIGRLSMGADDIVDNIIAAVEGAVEKIPKGWANVRSVLIKSDDSIGLPIYQALPETGLKIDVFPKGKGNVVDSEGDVDSGLGSVNAAVVQGTGAEEAGERNVVDTEGKVDAGPGSDSTDVVQGTGVNEVAKAGSAKKSVPKKRKLDEVRCMDTVPVEEDTEGKVDTDLGTDNTTVVQGTRVKEVAKAGSAIKSGPKKGKLHKVQYMDTVPVEEDTEGKVDACLNSDNTTVVQGTEVKEVAKVGSAKKSGPKKGKLHKVRYMDAAPVEEDIIFHSLGNKMDDNDEHSPHHSESGGKKRKNDEKRKQMDKRIKAISKVSSLPEANELAVEKSGEKKKRGGVKKLKPQQVDDGIAGEDPDELIGGKSQAKQGREGKKPKVQQMEDGTADEELDRLIGEKSQGKKREGKKKLKTQQVEDETVDEMPHSGTASKMKNKVKSISETDISLEAGGLTIEKSSGRKKPEGRTNLKSQKVEGPETAEKETFNKTPVTSDSAKKRKTPLRN